MSASYPTKLILAFRNGDRCAFPSCPHALTVEQPANNSVVLIGEAAHIAGEHAKAERYDAAMTDEQRDHYANLIYLCPNHHEEIDKSGGATQYPTQMLLQQKHFHERKVSEALLSAFSEVGFDELEFATHWLTTHQPTSPTLDLTLVSPDAKISKNGLSTDSRFVIRQGIGLAKEVAAFVESVSMTDADFPERLRAGFLEEYSRLVKTNVKGDDRFQLMCRFATHGMATQGRKAASVAILVYLFERCEVFEK